MSKVATSGPDAQGKYSLEVNIGGLTGTLSGFSSAMEAEDYAVSLRAASRNWPRPTA